MITNRQYTLQRSEIDAAGGVAAALKIKLEAEPLRWYVSATTDDVIVVEATECSADAPSPHRLTAPAAPTPGLDVVVNIVPTGIGCEIGGYAGDAAPATTLLASAADLVVTNPNAVNASNFIHLNDRVLYTEGYCLDLFMQGRTALHRPRGNRVGVIIEQGDPADVAEIINVINTVRAVHGVDIVSYVVTPKPIGTRCVRNPSGAYVGHVDRPDVLLAAARELTATGATAIAVTSKVRDLSATDYTEHFRGAHPNPVGGAEAIISHFLVRTLGVPAAHAPMVNFKDLALDGNVVDPRGAGEYISRSGLACVLLGLRNAPQLDTEKVNGLNASVGLPNVVAVVAPATSLGGIPVFHAAERGIPIIAVRDNLTILKVTAEELGLPGVVEVSSYTEAAGVVLALRAGLGLDTLTRPLVSVDDHAR